MKDGAGADHPLFSLLLSSFPTLPATPFIRPSPSPPFFFAVPPFREAAPQIQLGYG